VLLDVVGGEWIEQAYDSLNLPQRGLLLLILFLLSLSSFPLQALLLVVLLGGIKCDHRKHDCGDLAGELDEVLDQLPRAWTSGIVSGHGRPPGRRQEPRDDIRQ
jgi:hypothetical protein